MSLLIPLGLLGLLSVIALILIYIIKPNYQQKRISSTYVWKLSLKYKKKRIPISRLSQILIFICQLLVLTMCAIMLSKPAILEERVSFKDESVIIIDASASMMVSDAGESRFDRAVAEVGDFSRNIMENDGVLSIIVAGYEAYFLAQRSSSADSVAVTDGLKTLEEQGVGACTYGSADMEGAISLAEQVLEVNSNAKVYLYTATEYIEKQGINVVSVAGDDDWNAAILGCTAILEEDNFYTVSIDAGCYGRSAQIEIFCEIYGVNGDEKRTETVSRTEFFDVFEEEKNVKFTTSDFKGGGIYSFSYVHAYIMQDDGFEADNTFYNYGGDRPKIKVQYDSTTPNPFFQSACAAWRDKNRDRWDVETKELLSDETPAIEGYDIYIFEHEMPDSIPTDGVVVLFDLDRAPINLGMRLGNVINIDSSSTLAAGTEHPLTTLVDPDGFAIASYRKVITQDGFEELLYYGNDPVLLVKNEPNAKIVVFTGSLNFSWVPIRAQFPTLMYNLFAYFFPSTVRGNAFEIGQNITLNARGEDLTLQSPNGKQEFFNELPAEYRVDVPGTYTLSQTIIGAKTYVENFFVNVPNIESNITKEVDALPLLHTNKKDQYADKDLLIYFAAAMFAILFVEWLLQAREYFR